jgi:dihydrofolate reductase
MGILTFALNVTLDGCCDHREGVADDEMLRYWTRVMDAAGAMLFGRLTYEMMEEGWPQVARDPKATPANRNWAKKLEAKPKYVVSTTRRDFPWSNTHHVEGDLTQAVNALKETTPRGLLVGSPKLSAPFSASTSWTNIASWSTPWWQGTVHTCFPAYSHHCAWTSWPRRGSNRASWRCTIADASGYVTYAPRRHLCTAASSMLVAPCKIRAPQ